MKVLCFQNLLCIDGNCVDVVDVVIVCGKINLFCLEGFVCVGGVCLFGVLNGVGCGIGSNVMLCGQNFRCIVGVCFLFGLGDSFLGDNFGLFFFVLGGGDNEFGFSGFLGVFGLDDEQLVFLIDIVFFVEEGIVCFFGISVFVFLFLFVGVDVSVFGSIFEVFGLLGISNLGDIGGGVIGGGDFGGGFGDVGLGGDNIGGGQDL